MPTGSYETINATLPEIILTLDNPKKTRIYHPENAEKTVNWPKTRDVAIVEGLVRETLYKTIAKLPDGSRILDIGCGNGKFIRDIDEHYADRNFKLSTMTTTEVQPENINAFNDITYAYVPDIEWLRTNANSCAFIADTYASLTYSPNPLHSLLYLMLALEKGGELTSISSMVVDDLENSCFGNSGTRKAIEQFFKKHLGVELEFSLVNIESAACAPGKIMTDLKISLKVPKAGVKLSSVIDPNLSIENLFQTLCNLADQEIGIAQKTLQKETDFKAGTYSITPREYIRANGEKWEAVAKPQNNSSNLEILARNYAEDLKTEDFENFRKSRPVALIANRHRNWSQGSTGGLEYLVALYRLTTKKGMGVEDAAKELIGLTANQARYVASGLTAEEVRKLTPETYTSLTGLGDLQTHGETAPLEALCKYKARGLTADDLVWTLPWFKSQEQLEELDQLMAENKNLAPGIALTHLHKGLSSLAFDAQLIAANAELCAAENANHGNQLSKAILAETPNWRQRAKISEYLAGPGGNKGIPPAWLLDQCRARSMEPSTPETEANSNETSIVLSIQNN